MQDGRMRNAQSRLHPNFWPTREELLELNAPAMLQTLRTAVLAGGSRSTGQPPIGQRVHKRRIKVLADFRLSPVERPVDAVEPEAPDPHVPLYWTVYSLVYVETASGPTRQVVYSTEEAARVAVAFWRKRRAPIAKVFRVTLGPPDGRIRETLEVRV